MEAQTPRISDGPTTASTKRRSRARPAPLGADIDACAQGGRAGKGGGGPEGKRLGIGAGTFGAAGRVALFAFGALTAAAILAVATAVDAWLAALIVAAVYAAVAGVLALTGRRQI